MAYYHSAVFVAITSIFIFFCSLDQVISYVNQAATVIIVGEDVSTTPLAVKGPATPNVAPVNNRRSRKA